MNDPMDYIELELEWAQQMKELPQSETGWHSIFPNFRAEKTKDLKKWEKFYKKELQHLQKQWTLTKNLYAGPPSTHKEVDELLKNIEKWIEYSENELTKIGQEINKYEVKKIKGGITDEDIKRAKEVPLTSLGEAKRVGMRHVMLCLFHNDSKPSLVIFKENMYHCFVCEAHGDSIDYIQKREGLDFLSAVKYLINK